MTTQLNIKDAETVRRVRELARQRGEPVTATVRALVDKEWRERKEEKERRWQETLRVVREIQDEVRRITPPETQGMTLKEIMDSIYDVDGPDIFPK